jgi:hypothetical protein
MARKLQAFKQRYTTPRACPRPSSERPTLFDGLACGGLAGVEALGGAEALALYQASAGPRSRVGNQTCEARALLFYFRTGIPAI